MWILVIINIIGLLSGITTNSVAMYFIVGISFVSFFYKYAALSWDYIYSDRIDSSGIADAKIANLFVCFFVMLCIYILMVTKIHMWSVAIAIIQCIVFHIIKVIEERTPKNITIMIFYIAELFLSIIITVTALHPSVTQ